MFILKKQISLSVVTYELLEVCNYLLTGRYELEYYGSFLDAKMSLQRASQNVHIQLHKSPNTLAMSHSNCCNSNCSRT